MMDRIKHPFIAALLASSVLLVIGGLLEWFSFGSSEISDLVAAVAEEELSSKQNTAVIIGIIGVVTALLTAQLHNRFLPLVSLVVGLFAVVMIYNQLPNSEESALLEVSATLGYWMALIGAAGMTLTSAGTIFKLRTPKDDVTGSTAK